MLGPVLAPTADDKTCSPPASMPTFTKAIYGYCPGWKADTFIDAQKQKYLMAVLPCEGVSFWVDLGGSVK